MLMLCSVADCEKQFRHKLRLCAGNVIQSKNIARKKKKDKARKRAGIFRKKTYFGTQCEYTEQKIVFTQRLPKKSSDTL